MTGEFWFCLSKHLPLNSHIVTFVYVSVLCVLVVIFLCIFNKNLTCDNTSFLKPVLLIAFPRSYCGICKIMLWNMRFWCKCILHLMCSLSRTAKNSSKDYYLGHLCLLSAKKVLVFPLKTDDFLWSTVFTIIVILICKPGN